MEEKKMEMDVKDVVDDKEEEEVVDEGVEEVKEVVDEEYNKQVSDLMEDFEANGLNDPKGDDGKGFRIQSDNIMLTYKTHVDKEKLHLYIKALIPKRTITFIRSAHETGHGNTPYSHTHCVIMIKKAASAFQTKSSRFFDYEGIHPNIKAIKARKHLINCKFYLAKEDPMNSDLKLVKETSKIDKIFSHKTNIDAARKLGKNYSDISHIMNAFEYKEEVAPQREFPKLCLWQQKFVDELQGPSDGRTITFVVDKVGNSGKSELCSILTDNHAVYGRKFYTVTQFGTEADGAEIIKSGMEGGWTCDVILCDWARDKERVISTYASIESVANGRITRTKFKGKTIRTRVKPRVVVFCNYIPSLTRLSTDRYDIRIIEGNWKDPNTGKWNGDNLELVPISLDKAKLLGEEQSMDRLKKRVRDRLKKKRDEERVENEVRAEEGGRVYVNFDRLALVSELNEVKDVRHNEIKSVGLNEVKGIEGKRSFITLPVIANPLNYPVNVVSADDIVTKSEAKKVIVPPVRRAPKRVEVKKVIMLPIRREQEEVGITINDKGEEEAWV